MPNQAPIPQMLQVPNLLEAFYSVSPDRLNANGEGLLKLISLNESKTQPDHIVYTVDDCIKGDTFKAASQIIGSLLYAVLGDITDGVGVLLEWPNIIYTPIFQMTEIGKLANKPFGNFSAN